jgi:uncharacterized protein YjbI with pentapeptide repeats
MFSGNNKKEMTCEEWLRDMEGRNREMIADHLANRSDAIKQQVAAEDKPDNHAAYAVQALLTTDVKLLDAVRLEKAYEFLKTNKFPGSITKSIEISLAYIMYLRGAKMINAKVFVEMLCAATQCDEPAMIILPKAVLHGLNLSQGKFPANLSCANLQGADVSDCNMQGVQFKNCNLNNALLVKTDFQRCDMQGANLADANLLAAKFGSGKDRANMEDVFLLPDNFVFVSDENFDKFLEESRILGIPEKVILANINRNFINNKYSYEEKMHFYNKALYHPCFNTKTGMFSISKDAQLCKIMLTSQIKSLKANIAARDERLRREATEQQPSKK